MLTKRVEFQMYYHVSAILDYEMHSEKTEQVVLKLLTIRRLAKKHHRLAEFMCNGEGWIRGQRYYCGTIDDYARREYGAGVKSAFPSRNDDVDADVSVFDEESDKVEAKITDLVKQLGEGWKVEFQGDPRGNTVKVTYIDRWININF